MGLHDLRGLHIAVTLLFKFYASRVKVLLLQKCFLSGQVSGCLLGREPALAAGHAPLHGLELCILRMKYMST